MFDFSLNIEEEIIFQKALNFEFVFDYSTSIQIISQVSPTADSKRVVNIDDGLLSVSRGVASSKSNIQIHILHTNAHCDSLPLPKCTRYSHPNSYPNTPLWISIFSTPTLSNNRASIAHRSSPQFRRCRRFHVPDSRHSPTCSRFQILVLRVCLYIFRSDTSYHELVVEQPFRVLETYNVEVHISPPISYLCNVAGTASFLPPVLPSCQCSCPETHSPPLFRHGTRLVIQRKGWSRGLVNRISVEIDASSPPATRVSLRTPLTDRSSITSLILSLATSSQCSQRTVSLGIRSPSGSVAEPMRVKMRKKTSRRVVVSSSGRSSQSVSRAEL
jgi:hypothetical protein